MISNSLIRPRMSSAQKFGRIRGPLNPTSRWETKEMPWRSQSKSIQESTSGILNKEAKALSDQQFASALASARSSQAGVSAYEKKRLGSINDTYSQLLAMLAQQGQYEKGRIGRDFDAQRGSVGAATAGTGLYNTTVQENMRQGVERNRAEALLGLAESLRAQRAGAMAEKAGLEDNVYAQGLSASTQYATLLADLLGRQASTIPTMSTQKSQSQNLSY